MPEVVLDSTVLVSAFLTKTGVSAELLVHARRKAYHLCLTDQIIEETQQVLLEYQRIRKRYHYPDRSVIQFVKGLRAISHLSTNLPEIRAVLRDPNDDAVIACALAAKANYIVTRDKDLLSMEKYERVRIVAPEKFMKILRENPQDLINSASERILHRLDATNCRSSPSTKSMPNIMDP
ncbi:MAG: putative toxin-antitoxin system toxin component, PIN family [Armatimonadetes bacterium]|nr:putative toxin-antitoxin system toxin component, PIN family [Armatimonadota bacterium]